MNTNYYSSVHETTWHTGRQLEVGTLPAGARDGASLGSAP